MRSRREHGTSRAVALVVAVVLALLIVHDRVDGAKTAVAPNGLSPTALLGRDIFFDKSLSSSGAVSCASCHDPNHAYGPPNARAVQVGGSRLDRSGVRAVPSLRYVLARTPIFAIPHAADPIENLTERESVPAGGFTWDGRFDSPHAQASGPLLDPNEMANASPRAVLIKLQRAPYADRFRRMYGADVFTDPVLALSRAGDALQNFELEDPSFHPYTSKFDRYLDGTATLSAQERRGKRLFDDPAKGGCEACHVDARGADGTHPMFTDFQFEALGVPRNPEIAANANPSYYDLGLCGPLRRDHRDARYCGMFKTPSLRNVATRNVFFHNGRFHKLKDALRFYVQRDTNPERWYPRGKDGRVVAFDDMPAQFRGNVDRIDEPFTRKRGERPVWSDADVDAVAAFLDTLTDGWRPPQPRSR